MVGSYSVLCWMRQCASALLYFGARWLAGSLIYKPTGNFHLDLREREYYFHTTHHNSRIRIAMAKTATERKREQLERERRALLNVEDSSYPYLRVPFFEYLQDDPNWTTVQMSFELMGYEPPSFDNDLGPRHFANDDAFGSEEDRVEAFQGSEKSIGRAEVLVDHLMSAAVELSGIITDYKARELEARLKDLEEGELADPAERKAALQQAAHISRVLEELAKNQRVTLAKYRVKGV